MEPKMRWTPRMLLVAACVTCAGTLWAQTEADKATARTLAEEGVRLKQEQDYERALVKLQRAQQIYDAPTHLLLIAQCQVALGKLVEGAEAYRELLRRRLEPGVPAAFRRAQEQARAELAEVEPRIPSIRITVQPESVRGLRLRIDAQAVPTAVVGVNRLINPGQHVVKASAPGYREAQAQVSVNEGQQVPVQVVLEPVGAAAAQAGRPSAGKPGAAAYGEQAGPPEAPTHRARASRLELVGTLRLQGSFVGGNLGTAEFDQGVVTSGKATGDFSSGGGVELQGGLRFANHFAGLVLLGVDGFGAVGADSYGTNLRPLLGNNPSTQYEVKDTASPFFGLAAQYYSCKDCTAVVAELAFIGRALTQQVQYQASAAQPDKCDLEVSRSATMVRLTGGVDIPLSRLFHLMPYASLAGGGINQMQVKAKGGGTACPDGPSYESTSMGESPFLVIVGVGVAGSFVFGLK